MSNKETSINSSRLLDNKLEVLFKEYNDLVSSSSDLEQENLVILFNKIVSKFYSSLNNPLFDKRFKVREGDLVDHNNLNNLFNAASQDITILYKEINSLEDAIVRNFNNLATIGERLKSKVKMIRSNVDTYKFYTQDNDFIYFSDSFDNFNNVEPIGDLYTRDQCHVDINNGTLVLPINTSSTKQQNINSLIVGPQSNGTLGNNQEIGQLTRDSLDNMLDGNPDTWVEYEIVSNEPTASPLILDLKVTLETEAIINNIQILSNNFAIKTFPKIIELQTSLDGSFFTDLLQDIPTIGNDSYLILAPASGQYTGVNSYSFRPRTAKYIQLKIQQDDSYIIKTPGGIKYRKAIGLREFKVNTVSYKSSGELISTTFQAPEEIKKASILINESLFDPLCSIGHEITVDDQNWKAINPAQVLNFNTIDDDSINTSSPVTGIRYRATLERNSNKFNSQQQVIKEKKSNTQFTSINPGTPEVVLTEEPVVGSVNLYNISYGSVGKNNPLVIFNGNILERDGYNFIKLPDEFKNKDFDPLLLRLYVNDEPWTRVIDITSSASTDKNYQYDSINKIIKTGNGTHGVKVQGKIYVFFGREQILFSYDDPHVATLNFTCDSTKESINLYKLGQVTTINDYTLQKSNRILRLGQKDVTSITVVHDTSGILQTEKTFIDGSMENMAVGDYSVDYINGIIYTYSETSDTSDLTINYTYRPRTVINDFTAVGNKVSIPQVDYSTQDHQESIVLSNKYVIQLANSFIEPKSITFLSLTDRFIREVPFVGDGSEFKLPLTSAELAGLYTIDYKNGKIYCNFSITDTLILKYRFSSFFIEYNIAHKIPQSSFTVDYGNKKVLFTDAYISDMFSKSLDIASTRVLYRLDYDYISERSDNLKALESYYTPFLKDYSLKILPISRY